MRLHRFKFNLSYPMTLLGAILFFILGIQVCFDLWTYVRLASRTEIVVDQWKVIKKSSSSFPIQTTYHFEFQGKTYQCKAFLHPPYHLNRPSAEKALKNLEQQQWIAWFDPRNPHFSLLQKEFPFKKMIYTLIALGVTCYFGFLETHSKIRNPIH